MAIALGMNCKAFRNTGTYAAPVWDEIAVIKDLELGLEFDEADVSRRGGGGWKESEPTLLSAEVTFDFAWDNADSDITALRTAALGRTVVEMLILDGANASPSQGLRAHFKCHGFPRNEELADAARVESVWKPAPNANAAPAWYTAA